MKDETLAIHAGYQTDPTTKAVAAPIYQTVAFEFDNAQHGADLFNLAVPGNIYSRIMNPTCDVLEQRVAALEKGIAGLALSAGSAAVNYSILNLAEAGDNIVTVPQLYGGTYTLFAHMLPKQGIEARFAEDDSPAALEKLIDDKTKAVFFETIGNPAGNIVDVAAVCAMARSHGVATIADNTVATPVLLKPIEHGVDIVVHSLTKYMGGHGTTLGGIIVDSGQFPWTQHAQRYRALNEPEPSYHGVVFTEAMGPAAYIARARTVPCRYAIPARRSRRSTRSCCCKASKPCRCAWSGTATMHWRSRSTSRITRRWSGSASPACPAIAITRWRRSTCAGVPRAP